MSVSDMVGGLATSPDRDQAKGRPKDRAKESATGRVKAEAEVKVSGVDLRTDGQGRQGLRYSAPGEDGAAVVTGGQQTVERAADRRGKKVKRKKR